MKTLVHGDDFVSIGTKYSVVALNAKLRNRFDIKTCVIGSRWDSTGRAPPQSTGIGTGEVRGGKVLNRLVQYTEIGGELQANRYHTEMII